MSLDEVVHNSTQEHSPKAPSSEEPEGCDNAAVIVQDESSSEDPITMNHVVEDEIKEDEKKSEDDQTRDSQALAAEEEPTADLEEEPEKADAAEATTADAEKEDALQGVYPLPLLVKM